MNSHGERRACWRWLGSVQKRAQIAQNRRVALKIVERVKRSVSKILFHFLLLKQ
jgi:hypothetical protein